MERDGTVMIALGAVTAIGLNAKSTAAAVRAGISGFDEHPFLTGGNGEAYTLAMVPGMDPHADCQQRMIDMASPALQETIRAVEHLEVPIEMPAIIGLPEARPGISDALPELIGACVKESCKSQRSMQSIQFLQNGHCAGLMALEAGRRIVADRTAEFCLVGGIDSYVEAETLKWLEENEQLHQPDNAWGFIPGEAAGFCLVCTKDTANRNNLPVLAELLAITTANEQNRIKTETICLGQGLTLAVREVVQQLPQDAAVNYTICDQNGEAYRADEFGFTLTRLSDRFEDPSDYKAPADCWGDVGAASGPLFVNQICAAAERGYAKGPHTLVWTSSEGGERTAAIIKTDMISMG